VAEEWEIWDEEEEAVKSEAETKKLVPEKFHKWIKVFRKKQSERMPMRKVWDHAIDVKEGFVPRKGKIYVKIVDSGLHFLFSLLTLFYFLFYFSIFRTTRVRGYQLHCHISHKLMA